MQNPIRLVSTLLTAAALALATANPTAQAAAPTPGQAAPNFTLTDSNGKQHSLTDFKGKYVILEWTNAKCPFVVKHYASNNMQKTQKMAADKGAVWLAVNSSAAGKEGSLSPDEAKAIAKKDYANCAALLLDPDGATGKLYGAKTTPHMFIINPEGKVVYAGAIDSIKSADPTDIAKATNYVSTALEESLAGKPVTTSSSQPYGCSVKY